MFPNKTSILFLAVVVGGCGNHNSPAVATPAPAPQAAVDPDRRVYEQYRAGVYQLGSAQDNLQTATELSTKLSKLAGGTASKGFTDLLSKLNDAGQTLGDYTDDVPSFEEEKKEIAQLDDRRLNAIQAANDSLGDISDAQDIVENLLAGAPPEVKPEVQKLQDELDNAVEAVESGITAMGGKVEDDDSTAEPGSPGASAGG